MSADVSPVIEAADRLAGELPATALEALASVLEGAMVGAGLRDAVYAAISHSHYRALALKFIDVWRTIAPDVPAAGVALTLRTAAHCRTVSAEAQRLDLVWTGPDVPGAYRHTQPALLDLISRAKSRLTIVSFVAYKVPAVTTALADAARRGVDVRLILEDIEASQGKVASDALAAFGMEVAERSRVFVWPAEKRKKDGGGHYGSLHAKCAVADRSWLLISSANLTGFAMSLGFVVGGAILVEFVFNYPGVGYMLLNAVTYEDYPLMQALFLLITVAVLLAILLADIATAIFDPRTRTAG